MSRRKQSRPQPFKQFLEERSKSSDDRTDMPPIKIITEKEPSLSDEEEAVDLHSNEAVNPNSNKVKQRLTLDGKVEHQDEEMDYKVPAEFVTTADGLVAGCYLDANESFGPFSGVGVDVSSECKKTSISNVKAATKLQISGSDGTLYDINFEEETDGQKHWLTHLQFVTDKCDAETANVTIQCYDGKLFIKTLENISQGSLLKAIYVKEDSRRGVKRPLSNGIHPDQVEEATHKKISTSAPCSPNMPVNTTENLMTSSNSAMTSPHSAVTSSVSAVTSSVFVMTSRTQLHSDQSSDTSDSATETNDKKQSTLKTATSDGVVSEEEINQTLTAEETEGMENNEKLEDNKPIIEDGSIGPPFNCQHCCIEFRNPDNLEAHRTYYCPTTATQPLPASMRRVPPGANTVIKRRNRTPKQVKPAPPSQLQCSTPPATSSNVTTDDNPTGTYLCQLCQSSFTNHTNCESHMVLLHCDETVNLCKFCNFIASSLSQLKVHVFTHVKYYVNGRSSRSPDVYVSSGQRSPSASFQMSPSTSVGVVRVSEMQMAKPYKLNEHQDQADSDSGLDTQNQNQIDSHEEQKSPKPGSENVNTIMKDNRGLETIKPDTQTDMQNSPEYQSASDQNSAEKTKTEQCKTATELPVLKIPSTTLLSADKSKKVTSPHSEAQEQAYRCLECNISFMSRQNFMAHKQFYCAGRHQISPELPRQLSKVSSLSPHMSEERTHHRGQGSTSPSASRSPGSYNSNATLGKGDPHSVPHSSSSSSNHSTPSPLPTMVQLPGPQPRPTLSSESSSPALTSPPTTLPTPPYLIPGSVLSGMTPHGAPVLLVAVPFQTSNLRREDQSGHPGIAASSGTSRHSLPSNAEEEKPLDLSVKASRSSQDTASPTRSSPDKLPRAEEQESQQQHIPAAVIDLSHVSQSTLRPPPQAEQLNECKKCDIVFNKYESLLAHKQYYCASRHLRGRQIEMSYKQSVSPTRQSPSPRAFSDVGNRTEPVMQTIYNSASPKTDISDNLSRKSTDSVDETNKSVIIKQEISDGTDSPSSCVNKISNDQTQENNQGITIEHNVIDPSFGKDNIVIKREPSPDDSRLSNEHMNSTSQGQSSVKHESARTLDTGRSKNPDTELSKHVQRPFSCQACTVSFMKLESLDIHQQFYCAARNATIPHTTTGPVAVVQNSSLDETPVVDKGSTTSVVQPVVQRDSLFCKGCGQYFATSKQVRCHSCKNGKQNEKHSVSTLKRSSQDEANQIQSNVVDDAPPLKRCKSTGSSVIKCVKDGNEGQASCVNIKKEFIATPECQSPVADDEQSNKVHETRNGTFGNLHEVKVNGNRNDLVGQNRESNFCKNVNEPRQDAVSPTSLPIVTVKIEQEESMCSSGTTKQTLSSYPSNLPSDIPTGTTITSGTTVTSETSKAKTGYHRGISGVSLSGRNRIIQQPPAKHCSTCNIDFNSLSNFIAHKKYYCSARQQAKT